MPIISVYLLCQYLRTVPESDRDFLVPAHRDVLDHAAPKAAVKLADGAVLRFQYLDEVRQPSASPRNSRDIQMLMSTGMTVAS